MVSIGSTNINILSVRHKKASGIRRTKHILLEPTYQLLPSFRRWIQSGHRWRLAVVVLATTRYPCTEDMPPPRHYDYRRYRPPHVSFRRQCRRRRPMPISERRTASGIRIPEMSTKSWQKDETAAHWPTVGAVVSWASSTGCLVSFIFGQVQVTRVVRGRFPQAANVIRISGCLLAIRSDLQPPMW